MFVRPLLPVISFALLVLSIDTFAVQPFSSSCFIIGSFVGMCEYAVLTRVRNIAKERSNETVLGRTSQSL